MKDFKQWDGFAGRLWKEGVDVRDFIQNNYTPYDGDDSFLEGPTEATNRLWGKVSELQISFGEHFRNFRKKREQRAVSLIWRLML